MFSQVLIAILVVVVAEMTKYYYYSPSPPNKLNAEAAWNSKEMPLKFILVADLDTKSQVSEFLWESFVLRGELHWHSNFSVSLHAAQRITGEISKENRSMELSDLVVQRQTGILYAICDYTGLMWKITREGVSKEEIFLRWGLSDGDGRRRKPMKAEWATAVNNSMYVGSIGMEWTKRNVVLHRDAEWIKIIDDSGMIESIDWAPVYHKLRNLINASYPGYISHEAVAYSQRSHRWFLLPRRVSQQPFDAVLDMDRGSDALFVASTDFQDIALVRVQLQPDDRDWRWGWTAVRVVPCASGNAELLVALRVLERPNLEQQTRLYVFDETGQQKLPAPGFVVVSNHLKFEGIEFLDERWFE